MSQGTDIPDVTGDRFVQFVADNVNRNFNALDGYDTFHGMGMIAATTAGTRRRAPVPRSAATLEAKM